MLEEWDVLVCVDDDKDDDDDNDGDDSCTFITCFFLFYCARFAMIAFAMSVPSIKELAAR